MKVTVSCGGRFHAFHLAEQLQKRGYLNKFITTFFDPERDRIDPSKVVSLKLPEYLGYGIRKTPFIREKIPWNYVKDNMFDLMARRYVDECDIFVGWGNFCLHSMRKAKDRGAITIVECGSTHFKFQQRILDEEYNKYGLKRPPENQLLIEKKMKEFEEADYISIPSHFVYQSFLEEGFDADKLIKVPYGVDMTEFRQIPKKDDVFRVLFVGMLCLRKGLHYLLEAVSQLDLDNFELVLRGSVIDEGIIPFLEKYKEYYKIADFVPREDLHKIYSNSSVFVLPSLEEGLSMAIAEAMACGLPVIVSTNTGGEDIVRDGVDGFITPIRDVEAIKEKILFFYENEEKRKEMGNNAKERVKEFTWDRYGERIVEEYKKLLGEE